MKAADLVAVDVHAHAEVSAREEQARIADDVQDAATEYFKMESARRPTVPEIAAYYRERKMAAVVFPVDAEAATGQRPVPN